MNYFYRMALLLRAQQLTVGSPFLDTLMYTVDILSSCYAAV